MKLTSSFLVFLACALSSDAARQLMLDVDGPASVNTVEDLKVNTVLTNTGDETIRLLKDPLGPLSPVPAETFDIQSEAADTARGVVKPTFTGMRVKYSPQVAIEAGDYVTLAPGQSVTVSHNLGHAYDFTQPGAGSYTIGARSTRLMAVSSANTLEYITITPRRTNAKSRIAPGSRLRIALPSSSSLEKRANWVGCSSDRQSIVNTAASGAQSYAANALAHLNANPNGSTRYTTWFGRFSSGSFNTVKSHFSKISGNSFSGYTYDCSTCTENGWLAYVYATETGKIYLCAGFWRAPATGTDSRAGTLVHESSHWNAYGGAKDHVYGQSGAKSLAQSDPSRAIMNADSHEYFAENNPNLG